MPQEGQKTGIRTPTKEEKDTILVTLAKTAERPKQLKVEANANVAQVLSAAGIKLGEGDVVERLGQVLNDEAKVESGDILFITEDDDNGII